MAESDALAGGEVGVAGQHKQCAVEALAASGVANVGDGLEIAGGGVEEAGKACFAIGIARIEVDGAGSKAGALAT